jgi:hypothetical protein
MQTLWIVNKLLQWDPSYSLGSYTILFISTSLSVETVGYISKYVAYIVLKCVEIYGGFIFVLLN